MKVHALSILALTAALAACGSKTETNEAAATNTAAPAATETNAMAGDMDNMAMSPTAKMAKGTGKVTAVDKAAGTITLDHGPIAEANWPAMTMAFKAAPALIDSVKVGDEVNFELKLDGNAGEVTAITKQ
ncbi:MULTISPECIES: copper-binding protein [Sphingomonadaceae]|jgi:Cu/Ag efflux protein CusF|uniref:copper-binding protein n=1 Tax=Sphingomonadaceae TaxID=41297 RepID=UPI0006FBA4C6|nr:MULTISPECIES: copper-binding protein [Sphingomonadaceae]KRB79003.1 copper-binding protein [Sphingomonas sp. Root710]ODU79996.1 MAG: copper-binding protein [Novosphingobium sp. SCN 63-17]